MQNLYQLVKEYPGRREGDLAFYDPAICELHFVWLSDHKQIPTDFQCDVCDWFEEVSNDDEQQKCVK